MPNTLDLSAVLSRNLKYFMSLKSSTYRNANSLGKAARVSPNTVRNFLEPKRRTTTIWKPDGYPTLDKLEAIAKALDCAVWELLHPDIEKVKREAEFYKAVCSIGLEFGDQYFLELVKKSTSVTKQIKEGVSRP